MNRLDSNGVLNDYSVSAIERLAFDHAAPVTTPRGSRRPARPGSRPLTVDSALDVIEAERERARKARENSPLARLISGYYRL
jgi:hypothetical protein